MAEANIRICFKLTPENCNICKKVREHFCLESHIDTEKGECYIDNSLSV